MNEFIALCNLALVQPADLVIDFLNQLGLDILLAMGPKFYSNSL